MTTLFEVIKWGDVTQLESLIHNGASVHLQDEQGWTALHRAAERGNVPMVRALLKADADPWALTGEGKTALEIAEAGQKKEVIADLKSRMAMPIWHGKSGSIDLTSMKETLLQYIPSVTTLNEEGDQTERQPALTP